jgi:hypothetical protein
VNGSGAARLRASSTRRGCHTRNLTESDEPLEFPALPGIASSDDVEFSVGELLLQEPESVHPVLAELRGRQPPDDDRASGATRDVRLEAGARADTGASRRRTHAGTVSMAFPHEAMIRRGLLIPFEALDSSTPRRGCAAATVTTQ